MKNSNKIFALLALAGTMGLVSCIDETYPESSYATSGQVGESPAALKGMANGIPSQMCQGYLVYGEQVHETDMGYPQFMIAQTEMLGDMYPEGTNSGYDWYRNYNTFSENASETSYYSYLPWFTLYKFVKTANDIISTVDVNDANVGVQQKGYAGMAYAARAFDYYMLMVFFEPTANKYTDCSKVVGKTVPIVLNTTTNDMAKNNPRVSHDDMVKFILSDLDVAEKCLTDFTNTNKMLPTLATVYGLKAKVYLWDQKFDKAAEYARKAIDTSGATPMTEDDWTNPTTGFTTATPSWMWYIHYSPENMGNLCNLVGWISGEADWSYSSLTRPSIDKSLYDKIEPTDFRKHVFLDPGKYDYYAYKSCRDKDFIENAPDYLSLKFRCKGGNYQTYSVGGATDVPVMRVEEMYFIEALATGASSQGVGAGVKLLNSFMKTYRDKKYNYTGTDLRAFELEVLTQMRIEFWGEGNAFPVAKMLKPGVIQNYTGTNAPDNLFKINCEGIKPIWNLVIPISEVQANSALEGNNNPNPTATVTGPTTIGTYATGKY